jgi:hypothetical protein
MIPSIARNLFSPHVSLDPMARLIPSLFLSLTIAAGSVGFAAEGQPAQKAPTEALPPVLAPSAQTEKSTAQPAPRPRAVSPGVASILASRNPVFNPDAPKPDANVAAGGRLALDQPANGIVRLPDVYVRERRPIIFKPQAIYNAKGMADLAYRQYISEADRALNRWTLPLFGTSARERALQMYREDERLRNMSDLADAARIVSLTDSDAGVYVKRVSEQTYMRSSDFGWNGGRAANNR